MAIHSKYDTIMVIDDKPSNLNLLSKMLTEQGYRVRTFAKGKLALKSALNDPPDLILLDINMPEMSGYEVCQHLKKNQFTKDLPVIFISALTETKDKIKAFKLGGVDYITKPFQIEEVQARISLHLALKHTEASLAEKNKKLQNTLDDLKSTQQQLVQSAKMAALGVLVAGIAHEINNPINFIKTSILGLGRDMQDLEELLVEYEKCARSSPSTAEINYLEEKKKEIDYPTLKTEIPQLIGSIKQGVDRTEEIISSLRFYSRMDSVTAKESDLSKLISTALVILKNRYKNRISIVKKYMPLPALSVQPGKLTQVLINIFSNAIDAIETKFPTGKGTIAIETSIQSVKEIPYAVIAISDDGPGISKNILNKIFDPFFTTKAVGDGTGLGLSISIGIIKEHNGMIQVSTAEGKGTTFFIYLPIEATQKSSSYADASEIEASL
jgi:signal transduction histidine kinase